MERIWVFFSWLIWTLLLLFGQGLLKVAPKGHYDAIAAMAVRLVAAVLGGSSQVS